MPADSDKSPANDKQQNGIDEREIRQESAKAAQKARQAQRKAYELRQAAYGAGDPEERQELMEKAIDKEVEAESFGKTAKYMRRGTFQGMAVGAGLGVVPGLTLGTLTGTLVGGLVSIITGGLGAAGGAIVGAIHGPFWNMGEVAGKSIQKITGNLPGWEATAEQKWYLENMIGQAKQEQMPTAHELEFMRQDDGSRDWGSYVENATSWTSSIPAWMKKQDRVTNQRDQGQQRPTSTPTPNPTRPSQDPSANRSAARASNQKAGDDLAHHLARQETQPTRPADHQTAPRPSLSKTSPGLNPTQDSAANASERRKPRKLETRSPTSQPPLQQQSPAEARKPPRKLERRG